MEALKEELEQAKNSKPEEKEPEATPANPERIAELEKELEEKKARIAELEASLKDSNRVVYMEDVKVKEMSRDYEERTRLSMRL